MIATAERVDVIDQILGADNSGKIVEIRGKKPILARQLQAYYGAIFAPTEASAKAFSLANRAVIAVRVASFTRSAAVAEWYAALAKRAGVSAETIAHAKDVAAPWTDASELGAAVRHADLLTVRPSDSRPSDLLALKNAGLTPAGILSLSQTIAFVSYQLRLVAGLRAIGA